MNTTFTLRNILYAVSCLFLVSGIVEADSLLVNPDFELVEFTGDFYGSDGGWYGDDSAIVPAENGITPYNGSQMLQFIYAHRYGGAVGGSASQVYQLVDLTPFADQIETGLAVASASFWVNRVQGDAFTDTGFGLGFVALDSSGAVLVGEVGLHFESDGDISTWELVEHDFLIPVGTTKLRLQLHASENIYNDTSGVEFDGHYGDNASLAISVIPEPASVCLISLFLSGVCFTRRIFCG